MLTRTTTPLAAWYIASPAWVPLLENINIILTCLTLLLGLIIGLLRLRSMLRKGAGDEQAE